MMHTRRILRNCHNTVGFPAQRAPAQLYAAQLQPSNNSARLPHGCLCFYNIQYLRYHSRWKADRSSSPALHPSLWIHSSDFCLPQRYLRPRSVPPPAHPVCYCKNPPRQTALSLRRRHPHRHCFCPILQSSCVPLISAARSFDRLGSFSSGVFAPSAVFL